MRKQVAVYAGMNRLLFGLMTLVAMLGSTAALADWRHERGGHGRHGGRGWGQGRFERYERYEPRYEPQRYERQSGGRYELRTTNVWVPGTTQQIWVPGNCYQTAWGRHCQPGSYQTYVTQGHYEARQEYVWVPCG